MKNVMVVGGSYCSPCHILRDWLLAGGISGAANYQYIELGELDIDRILNKGRSFDPDFAAIIPAVFVEDENGVIIHSKNGATQTWIKEKLGITADGVIIDEQTEEGTSDAVIEDEIMFFEWVEDETFGIENEILLLGGLALFIIIIGYILSRAGWLK